MTPAPLRYLAVVAIVLASCGEASVSVPPADASTCPPACPGADAGPGVPDASVESPDAAAQASDGGSTQADASSAPDAGGPVGPQAPSLLHAAASAACANMPLRSTGTVHYFCDCAAGAQQGCEPGNDSNPGTSPSAPKQSWREAINTFNAMNAGDTVALCKGGFWNVPAANDQVGAQCGYAPQAPALRNSRCGPGAPYSDAQLKDPANAGTCDLRDYQAPWGGSAKPVLYAYQPNPTYILLRDSGSVTPVALNGVRILNLELRGGNGGPNVGPYYMHRGIGFSTCNFNADDSWLVCNDTFTHLNIGIHSDADKNDMTNLVVWGNRFTMNDGDGWLGPTGDHARIDANFFDNNGGMTTNPVLGNWAHNLYITGAAPSAGARADNVDVQIVNNEFRRSGAGGAVGVNQTAIIGGHEYYDYLNIENNIVDAGGEATGWAWAITLDPQVASPYATHYRHTTIRRNLIYGPSVGIALGSDPGGIVENNVIVLVASPGVFWQRGIISPYVVANTTSGGGDDVGTNVTIRNNTIYMTGPSGGDYIGVLSGYEGTGHVVANNAIFMAAPSGNTCFSTPLTTAGTYSFVGNNACYGGTWGTSFDMTSRVTEDPRFTSPLTDFTPAAGSPLIGAGSAAHAPSTDFMLRARPNPPSIGAYEP